jgi:hypothetical protein
MALAEGYVQLSLSNKHPGWCLNQKTLGKITLNAVVLSGRNSDHEANLSNEDFLGILSSAHLV